LSFHFLNVLFLWITLRCRALNRFSQRVRLAGWEEWAWVRLAEGSAGGTELPQWHSDRLLCDLYALPSQPARSAMSRPLPEGTAFMITVTLMPDSTSGAMAALRWALLCAAWGAARPALQSGLRVPEVDPSRFLIDYAYLRRDYPCSPEERRCFDYGRLLHPADGRCYRVGERGPCAEGQLFHADRAQAQGGGGFRGSCASHCADALHVRLAATGGCVSLADLHLT
ncbi:Protein of unknown function, partial [Gryllus bimaculatus]